MSTVFRVRTLKVSVIAAGILSVALGVICTIGAIGAISTISVSAQTIAPVVYQGLRHTPIGGAALQLDTSRNTLDVNTSDPSGGDGVAVDLDNTTSWSAQLGTSGDPGLSLAMTWHAIADGQRISSAFLRQIDDRFALNARFTGSTASTYAVQVYDNGRLVGALGGVPPTAHVYIPRWIPCEFLEHGCSFIIRFHNNANHECEWNLASRNAGPITLPNGAQVTGNEVRLIEEVHAGGQYPYLTFDGLTMQTNARVLTLFSESAR
jgi:hypothetical protein